MFSREFHAEPERVRRRHPPAAPERLPTPTLGRKMCRIRSPRRYIYLHMCRTTKLWDTAQGKTPRAPADGWEEVTDSFVLVAERKWSLNCGLWTQRITKPAATSALHFLPLNEHPRYNCGENRCYPARTSSALLEMETQQISGGISLKSLPLSDQERLETLCCVKKGICSLKITFPVGHDCLASPARQRQGSWTQPA